MRIRNYYSKANFGSGDSGFSLPEVLIAIFIVGLFMAVLAPIMRDTLYYASRLTERLPMAHTLEATLEIDRSGLSTLPTTISFVMNGLKIERSIKSLKYLTSNTLKINQTWQPIIVSTRVESSSGMKISKDMIMLSKVKK